MDDNLKKLARIRDREFLVAKLGDFLRGLGRPRSFLEELQAEYISGTKPGRVAQLRRWLWWVSSAPLRQIGRLLPAHAVTASQAHDLFRRLLTERHVVTSMVRSRPYLGVPVLDHSGPLKKQFLRLYIEELLRSPESALVYELRSESDVSFKFAEPEVKPMNRILRRLVGDANDAHSLALWKPVGDTTLRCSESPNKDMKDRGNAPLPVDFEESGFWDNPVFVGITLFDLMVSIALYQGVRAHFFVHYFLHIAEAIASNCEPIESVERQSDEWPSQYAFLLSCMTSTLSGWVAIGAKFPEQANAQIENVDTREESGHLLKSCIVVFADFLRIVSRVDNLPLRFRERLACNAPRTYLELESNPDTKRAAEVLLLAMTTHRYQPEAEQAGFRRFLRGSLQDLQTYDYKAAAVAALQERLAQ